MPAKGFTPPRSRHVYVYIFFSYDRRFEHLPRQGAVSSHMPPFKQVQSSRKPWRCTGSIYMRRAPSARAPTTYRGSYSEQNASDKGRTRRCELFNEPHPRHARETRRNQSRNSRSINRVGQLLGPFFSASLTRSLRGGLVTGVCTHC